MAPVDQNIEFRRAVAAVIPVVEINPKPNAPFAVIHVNRSAIECVRMGQKNYHSRGELNPALDFGEFSKLEKLAGGFVEGMGSGELLDSFNLQFAKHFICLLSSVSLAC